MAIRHYDGLANPRKRGTHRHLVLGAGILVTAALGAFLATMPTSASATELTDSPALGTANSFSVDVTKTAAEGDAATIHSFELLDSETKSVVAVTEATPVVESGESEWRATFDSIPVSTAGEVTYIVREQLTEAVRNNGGLSPNGVTYDTQAFTVTVTAELTTDQSVSLPPEQSPVIVTQVVTADATGNPASVHFTDADTVTSTSGEETPDTNTAVPSRPELHRNVEDVEDAEGVILPDATVPKQPTTQVVDVPEAGSSPSAETRGVEKNKVVDVSDLGALEDVVHGIGESLSDRGFDIIVSGDINADPSSVLQPTGLPQLQGDQESVIGFDMSMRFTPDVVLATIIAAILLAAGSVGVIRKRRGDIAPEQRTCDKLAGLTY